MTRTGGRHGCATVVRLAMAVAAVLSSGCSIIGVFVPTRGTPVVIHAYSLTAPSPAPDAVRAGVARVDITPPPGYPTGGHGPAGALARGYWTRLYARAFYLQDAQRHPVVLVSCDLLAIPAGLRAAVMRNVGLEWNARGVVLPPASFVIAATHTHQGPGNFMTAAIYNGYGSKYGGFDRALFDFLVARVTDAVNRAIADAMTHPGAGLWVRTTRVSPSLFLNRSPATFLLNWNAARLSDEWHDADVECVPTVEQGEARQRDWDLRGCPRLRGLDPALTVLQVRRGSDMIGALVFAAVHPTVLDHGAPLFSSDFTGVAMRALERERASGTPERAPVIAFFNGAEGDVVARRGRRDLRDVMRIARMFAADVRAALQDQGSAIDPITIESREVALVPGSSGLSPKPMFGAAALGGGEDDRTVLYQLGWREGLHEVPSNGQGGKLPALDSQLLPAVRLTSLFAPPRVFPQQLPVGYVRIGWFALGTLPAEISSAQGAAIRRALGPHGEFEIVGLANEYASYVATADEYDAQDYMGASTIWGPREGEALLTALQQLAGAPASIQLAAPEKRFRPGPKVKSRRFTSLGGPAVGEGLSFVDSELGRILLDRDHRPVRTLPAVVWREDDAAEFASAGRRRVRILERTTTGWRGRATTSGPDDDEGSGLITLLRESPAGTPPRQRSMTSIWVAPVLEDAIPPGEFKFEVTIDEGAPNPPRCLESDPFVVDLTPARRATPLEAKPCQIR